MTVRAVRRQPDCPGTGRKLDGRKTRDQRSRDIVCPDCGRTVALNYDGRIRHHVAALK